MDKRRDRLERTADMSAAASDRPAVVLEIVHGQTRFPFRPVNVDRFLIGSSPTCDLCLGGGNFPVLHSMIVLDRGQHRWETVMSEPAVLHNGRAVDSFLLHAGDHIQLGPIEFAVHFDEGGAAIDMSPTGWTAEDDELPEVDHSDDLTQLSAEELLDRMDDDRELVELFESKKQLGLQALLEAALSHADSEPSESQTPEKPQKLTELPPRDDSQLLASLELMAAQLNDCAKDLEQRATAIAAGHERLAETLRTVMEAERHLAERLATVFEKMPLPSGDAAERSAA